MRGLKDRGVNGILAESDGAHDAENYRGKDSKAVSETEYGVKQY